LTPRQSETGAALLTVLMLVAVIGVITAAALERMKIATRQSINMVAIDQARAYGLAAETIALSRIADLVGRDAGKTTLDGDWQGREIPFPIDGGTATAKLLDGGNCFNLNSIVTGEATTTLSARPVAIEQFTALMTILGVQANTARPIALALADWVDSDSSPLPGGAEDGNYARAQIPYRTANTLMADASEVRVLAGMTPEIYATLRPWICALPVTDLSPINVNTLLPAQAPLVAMLIPGRLDLQTAKRMIDERPQGGYGSVVNFWNLPAQSGITPSPEVLQQTKVKTRWFTLDLSIALAGAELRETALVDGLIAPARLVRRVYGDPA
jgi:general secretion pathway protein K